VNCLPQFGGRRRRDARSVRFAAQLAVGGEPRPRVTRSDELRDEIFVAPRSWAWRNPSPGIDRHHRLIDRVQAQCFNGSRWSMKRGQGAARPQPPHARREVASPKRRSRSARRDRGMQRRRDCRDCPMQLDRCHQRRFTTRADCGTKNASFVEVRSSPIHHTSPTIDHPLGVGLTCHHTLRRDANAIHRGHGSCASRSRARA
jgi:hypothetical protein